MDGRVLPIDWREQFNVLNPYIKGRGGVIRIRYMGQPCAPFAFISTLKSMFESKGEEQNWRTIRIDKEIYTTRYLSGIREVFIKKMRINLSETYKHSDVPISFNVATGLEAENDLTVDVSNITQNIFYPCDNQPQMSRDREQWTSALFEQISVFLEDGHLMVIVSHGDATDQDNFWRYLWEDCLRGLIDDGLVLVHMVDSSDKEAVIHDLVPMPQLEIDLPIAFSPQAQKHAIEDLTSILLKKIPGMSFDLAQARAEALVETHVDDIPRLHSKYAGYLMRLAQKTN